MSSIKKVIASDPNSYLHTKDPDSVNNRGNNINSKKAGRGKSSSSKKILLKKAKEKDKVIEKTEEGNNMVGDKNVRGKKNIY